MWGRRSPSTGRRRSGPSRLKLAPEEGDRGPFLVPCPGPAAAVPQEAGTGSPGTSPGGAEGATVPWGCRGPEAPCSLPGVFLEGQETWQCPRPEARPSLGSSPRLVRPGRPQLPIQGVATPAAAAGGLRVHPAAPAEPALGALAPRPWSCFPPPQGRLPHSVCLPFKTPGPLARTPSCGSMVGSCPAPGPPCWPSQDSLPAWAGARPSWPPLSLGWTTGSFMSAPRKPSENNPAPAPGSPSRTPGILAFLGEGFLPHRSPQDSWRGLRPWGQG